ncbi:S24 family peptidase [Streptococcus suis]|nr:S24 family peptidase [Streptococcus suis]
MDEYETKEVFTDKEYLYDIATWIDGHSMEPVYHNGEIALIREGGFDYDGQFMPFPGMKNYTLRRFILKKKAIASFPLMIPIQISSLQQKMNQRLWGK